MVLRFGFVGSSERRRDATRHIKSWVREMLALDSDAVVSVASHPCIGRDCGEAGAIILIARAGHRTRSIKLSTPLDAATRADIRAALRPIMGEGPAQWSSQAVD